jgi:tetratricopeptide (TPR) repeat protein
MKRPYLTINIFALCAILLFSVNDTGIASAQPQPNQFQSYLKLGIKKAFNMEFSNANIYLQKAVELDQENPTGYALLSMINLFAYEMSFDENTRKNNQDSMLRYVDETLVRGEKRIGKNPKDGKAYLAMAMAKMARFNFANHHKQYLSIAREASTIWEYLEKAKENDPQNYDIYYLMGSFRYHIDHLPRLTRFLSSLVVTSGDKQKGLQELELAAQKGDLLKQLALSELSADYLNFEKQPARALPIIRKLKETFPDNYNFSFALANTLSDLGRFDDAFNIAREIEKNIRTGLPPFAPQLQPRYDQLMGRIFLTQGDYVKAEEFLQRALKDTTPYNARVRTWAYLRLGMINDARKERKKAEEYYSKALDVKEGEGTAQIEARKYLKTPCILPAKKKTVEILSSSQNSSRN